MFSEHVVQSGTDLYSHFTEMKLFISSFFRNHFDSDGRHRSSEDSLAEEFKLLKTQLVRFDELWTEYEQKYVYELMVIEGDARRFIIDSINIEAVLMQDHMQNSQLQPQFDEKRKCLLDYICQVNTVANVDGKGRDDF